MKLSSKKVPAAKVQRPPAPAREDGEDARLDRTVVRMVAGLNEARRTGKFPKVY